MRIGQGKSIVIKKGNLVKDEFSGLTRLDMEHLYICVQYALANRPSVSAELGYDLSLNTLIKLDKHLEQYAPDEEINEYNVGE